MRSGTSREAVEKAESELNQLKFMTWINEFIQPRASRTSFDVEESQQIDDDNTNSLEDSNVAYENDNLEETNNEERTIEPFETSLRQSNEEESFELSPAIAKEPTEKTNNQDAKKKVPTKRKLSAINEREMDHQRFSFMKKINQRLESREKKKLDDAEDRFVATVADELRALPYRERLLAKNEIKNTLFRYQIQVLERGNNRQTEDNALRNQDFQQGYQFPVVSEIAQGNSFPNQSPYFRSPESTQYRTPAQSPSYPPVSYTSGMSYENLT